MPNGHIVRGTVRYDYLTIRRRFNRPLRRDVRQMVRISTQYRCVVITIIFVGANINRRVFEISDRIENDESLFVTM